MAGNLLKNPSFEGGTHHQTFAELSVPDEWVAFWHEGAATHDPANPTGYARPEMRVIPDEPPFKGPNRVHSDSKHPTPKKALMYFAFGKIMDAGVYQQVTVQPHVRLRATAWAQGWSNHGFDHHNPHADDPRWSEGGDVGKNAFFAEEGTLTDDAARNLRFRVGIDPGGGTDARAASVVWGKSAHIYNAHAQVPAVEVTAQASTITVFLRCDALWPFKHNDAYWDDAELEMVSTEPARLSLKATPVVGIARVGSAVLIEGTSSVTLLKVDLKISGASAAPQVFSLLADTPAPHAVWRWMLVPDVSGDYVIELSALDAEPAKLIVQVKE